MGAGESVPLPPWEAPVEGATYPEEVVEAIVALPGSAEAFLQPDEAAEELLPDFTVEQYMAAIEGAMLHDERFSKWLPKLVPKRVDEEAFWKNYFSHVQRILSTLRPHGGVGGGTAGTADGAEGAEGVEGAGGEEAAAGGADDNGDDQGDDEQYPAVDLAAVAAAAGVAPPSLTGRHQAPADSVDGADDDASEWQDERHPTPKPPPGMDVPPEAQREREERAAAEAEVEADGFSLQDLELLPEPPLEINARDLGRPIRWGVIGCGSVCELKAGPAFQRAAGSKLVAVMRRTPELARDFARRHGVPKCYTDVDQLVHDPEVDAVYIATPPGSHCELALKVCQAGKPCLVEKPMARHFDECRAMVNAFYRVNLPLYVAYYRRRHDRFVKAKQIVRRFLGTVTSVECVLSRNDHLGDRDLGWRVQPEHSGGGLFVDLGSHTLDILDFLLGPLDHVSGDAVTHPAAAGRAAVETAVSMTFRTQAGAMGVAVWDFCSAIHQDRLTIKGTKASLVMSVFGREGPKLFLPSGRSVQYRNEYPDHTHQPLVESIVQQLRGAQVPAERLSTGESAARTAAIVDSVLRKFYRSRNDHFWTRPSSWDNQR